MTTQRAFGRRHAPDPRDRGYLMRALVPERVPVATRYYQTGPILDQGSTPQCVAFAFRQWLSSALLMTKTGPTAADIYREAQKLDEWPDDQPYDGTSVRGGVKALQARGHVASYLWAFDAATVRDFIVSGKGTVVLGTDWYEGMMEPDGKLFLNPTGSVVGGHAYLISGYSKSRDAFRVAQSWGLMWGDAGRAWLRFADADKLIKADGEACTAVEQKIAVKAA